MTHGNRGRLTVDPDGYWRLYTATPPKGSTVLGTVTRNGYDTGALVRFTKTGAYAQVNETAIRSLDQNKVVAAIAAARSKKS